MIKNDDKTKTNNKPGYVYKCIYSSISYILNESRMPVMGHVVVDMSSNICIIITIPGRMPVMGHVVVDMSSNICIIVRIMIIIQIIIIIRINILYRAECQSWGTLW